jgi:AraC-like DNA-binding protein
MHHHRRILLPNGSICLLRWGLHGRSATASRRLLIPDTWGCNAVVAGVGTYQDAAGVTVTLHPGDVFLRQPGSRHATRMPIGYRERWLSIDAATANSLSDLGLLPVAPIHRQAWTPIASTAFNRLSRRGDLAGFLAVLAGCRFAAPVAAEEDAEIRAAQMWMEAHLDRRFTLAMVAVAVGLRPEALRKRFQRQLGQGVLAWAIAQRMRLASRLLITQPVGEVARRLGYADLFTFSTHFLRHIGQRPSVLRRVSAQQDPRTSLDDLRDTMGIRTP